MLVAYIYSSDGTAITQIFKLKDFQSTKKLNDISTASFSISILDKNCNYTNFKEFNRCKVCYVSKGSETTIIDGVIRPLSANLAEMKIAVYDYNFILQNKMIYADRNYVGATIDSILADILGEINARYNTGITLDCGITATISKKYYKCDNLLYILKDLALSGYEFDVIDKVLVFKSSIGSDKSSGADFVEFRYDIVSPRERNVIDASIEFSPDNIANAILGKDGTNFSDQTDPTSIANFGRIEKPFTASGDIVGATAQFLADHKDSIREISITPKVQNLASLDIIPGDIVKAYIDGGNDILFYDGTLKIIERSFSFGDILKIGFKLSTSKIRSYTILETIRNLRDDVKKLQIK